MVFNSIEFLIFFPIVVLAYYILPPKVKMPWLLISSYFFYMCWNPKYAFLILFSTIITYSSGLLLESLKKSGHTEQKKKYTKNLLFSSALF